MCKKMYGQLLLDTQSSCYCGLAQPDGGQHRPVDRIVGGVETSVIEFPWTVRILIKWDKYQKKCGGSLISNRWILTAQHCTEDSDPIPAKYFEIFLAEHDTTSETEADTLNMKIVEIISHSQFGERFYGDFDIALLKMEQILDFSKHPKIRPICLPTVFKNNYENYKATASGWGKLKYTGEDSKVLRKVELKVMSNAKCTEKPYKWQSTSSNGSCTEYNGNLHYLLKQVYEIKFSIFSGLYNRSGALCICGG